MATTKIGIAAVAAALLLAATPLSAKTLKWAADAEPGTMDPHSRNVTFTLSMLANIYEPLARRNKDLKLEPALATEWRSTGSDVWRYTLRRNVKFHDGSPFTADDVVFTYQRTRGPGSLLAGVFASVKEIRKVDDFTVEFVTNGPNPILPDELAPWLIMSKSWAEKNNAVQATAVSGVGDTFANRNANGTGPFVLKSREADGKIIASANANWWDRPEHNLTEVVFTQLQNPATRTAALLSGDVDMVYSLPLANVDRVAATPGYKVLRQVETRTMYFGFDVLRDELADSNVKGKNPFKDLRVRQAMQAALDVGSIQRSVMRGFSVPNFIMVGPGINGFDPSINAPYDHNPDRGKQLMTEAGYGAGFDVNFDCSNDRWINDEQICVAVTAMWARIGVRAKLRAQPFSNFVKLLSPPYETSLFMVGWSSGTYDAHNPILNLMTTRKPGSPRGLFNVGGYSNPRIDALADLIQVELDPDKRRGFIKEALTIVKNDVAYIPFHQQMVVWAAKDGIELAQLSDNWFPYRYVRIK
jgi:peptide/nickel transport system substrate-binding protein